MLQVSAVLRPARDRKHQLILRSINVGSLVRHFEEASTDCAACSDNQRYENISHCFYDCPVAQAIWEWFEEDIWKRLFKMIFPITDKYLLITGDHSHITAPNLFGNKTDAAIWAILHSFVINQIYLARCSFHPDISKVENPTVRSAKITAKWNFWKDMKTSLKASLAHCMSYEGSESLQFFINASAWHTDRPKPLISVEDTRENDEGNLRIKVVI